MCNHHRIELLILVHRSQSSETSFMLIDLGLVAESYLVSSFNYAFFNFKTRYNIHTLQKTNVDYKRVKSC